MMYYIRDVLKSKETGKQNCIFTIFFVIAPGLISLFHSYERMYDLELLGMHIWKLDFKVQFSSQHTG